MLIRSLPRRNLRLHCRFPLSWKKQSLGHILRRLERLHLVLFLILTIGIMSLLARMIGDFHGKKPFKAIHNTLTVLFLRGRKELNTKLFRGPWSYLRLVT